MSTKSHINTSGLKNTIPKNTQAKSNLLAARNQLSGISMPSNFQYASLLNTTIPKRIEKIESAVEEINTFIDKKIGAAINKEKKENNLANSLTNILGNITGTFGNEQISSSLMNNPDYEYYMKTQGKNKNAKSPSLFPLSEAYLEQKYGKSMAKVRETNISSIINLVIGGVKGVSKAGETSADGYFVGQANSISINNPDWRYFTNGDKSKIDEYARQYKRETMTRVSKDYTQSWYNNFYNTKIGKDLDKKAGTPFKSNGAATKFVTNMTYRGTLMAAGGNPIGAGFLGYLSGKGEATQSYWSQAEIQAQIKSGKNIDKIFETGNDYGNAKGTWTGISMAFQKATGSGGKVDDILNKPWKRVLADATVGGLEVPATAYANSKINGKSFKETFEEEGGLKAVGINAGSSGAVSLLGELVRWGIRNETGRNNSSIASNIDKEVYEERVVIDGRVWIIKKGQPMPLNLQFFANKKKEYIDLQTIEEIKEMYGSTDDFTRMETNRLLKEASRLIDRGELDGNQNFYTYMMDNLNVEGNGFGEYANYNTLMRRLTVKEAQYINLYTEGSTKVQEFLGEKVLDDNTILPGVTTKEQMINYINTMDSALEKGANLKNNQIFNRGMTWKQMEEWGFTDYDFLKASEGNTFDCKNYISTGVTKEGSFYDREVIWRIKCDAGKNYGAYINEISKYSNNTNEYEFLMKRGAQMRIDKVDRMDLIIDNPEHGITYIDATILGFKPEKIDENIKIKLIHPSQSSILIQ